MKKSKKFLIAVLMVAVIAVCSFTPTFSWLSSKSDRVVNTFAGGAISIVLDEAPVDTNGHKIEGARVNTNSYKYVAGSKLDKDPRATVLKGSEPCYVFICVDNELNEKFSLNIDTKSWREVQKSGTKTLYVHVDTVEPTLTEDAVLEPIFTQVSVSEDLTAEDIEKLGEKTISVTAYAVQKESMTEKGAIELAVAEFMPELSQDSEATTKKA